MKQILVSALLSKCLDGEEEAMGILYDISVIKIRAQMRKAGIQQADIEDIIQETMMRVFAKMDQLKNPECYISWLYKVTKSVYNQYFKTKNRYLCSEISEQIEESRAYMLPIGCMENIENERIINQRMSQLKTSWQEVLEMKYLMELSEEEISKKMKIPKGTVKSRLHYAKLRLQAQG